MGLKAGSDNGGYVMINGFEAMTMSPEMQAEVNARYANLIKPSMEYRLTQPQKE
jgi:hypothetical protein